MAVPAVIQHFDFHTSNIQRAQMKRLAQCIVRSGNPIQQPPEGRSLRDALSVNGTQKQNAFSARKRYFVLQRPFLPYLFPQEGKDMARGAADAASQTAPRLRRIRNELPETTRAFGAKIPRPSAGRKVPL